MEQPPLAGPERHWLYGYSCGHWVETVTFIGDARAVLMRWAAEEEITLCLKCRHELEMGVAESMVHYEDIKEIPQEYWDRDDICKRCVRPMAQHGIYHDPPEGDPGLEAIFDPPFSGFNGLYCLPNAPDQ